MVRPDRRLLISIALALTTACGLPPTPPFESEILVYCDASEGLAVADVLKRVNQFEAAETTPPRRSRSAGVCWFRYELQAETAAAHAQAAAHPAGQVYLQVQTITSRTLDVFVDGKQLARMGTTRSFESRPIPHRGFVIPVMRPDRGAKEILFRIGTGTVAEVPLRVWEPAAFHETALAEYYALGAFFGVLLVMAAYNFLLGLAIREPAYLYYVFYTFSVGLFIANEDGLAAQWFNQAEETGHLYFAASMSLLAISSMLFARYYLETYRFSVLLDRALLFWALFSAILLVFALTVMPIAYLSPIFNLNNLLVILLAIWAISAGVRRGHRPAQIFAVAFFVFIASVLLRMVWLLDLPIASNAVLLHGPKIGVSLELVILSLGLADRYNRLRNEMLTSRMRHAAERERLLGEVHDSIGARISAALMQVPAEAQSAGLRGILESALEYARDLSALLRQSAHEENFEDDVVGYIRTLDGLPGVRIDFHFDAGLNAIEGQRRIDLTRIFQEWISNCVRHAGARDLKIQFERRGGRAVLAIRSDGLPFAWRGRQDSPGAGSGLRGILARAQRLKARFRSMVARPTPAHLDGDSDSKANGSLFVLSAPLTDAECEAATQIRKSP